MPLMVATWNVRTLLDNDNVLKRRTALVAHELKRYNIDICALSETRFHGEDSIEETSEGYTFFWKGVNPDARRLHGVGFAVKSSLLRSVQEMPTGINERLMTWRIPLSKGQHATLISAYAPTLDADNGTKETFYDLLDELLRRAPRTDKILLLGDFNARVGTDYNTWKGVLGRHGTGKCNNNGVRLLTLCAQHNLIITNSVFQLKDKYKTSWKHPRSSHWHLLDYVITRQADQEDILITRALRGAECSTDHQLIRSKVRLNIRPPIRRTRPAPKLNCDTLSDLTTKTQLRQNIAAQLNSNPPNITSLNMSWTLFKTSVLEAAEGVLGFKVKKHQDWFGDNSNVISLLLEQKKRAHDAYLACPQSPTLKLRFQTLRNQAQQTLREIENSWWIQKAAEIQGYADSNNSHRFYDAIKSIYGPQRKNLVPVKGRDGTLLKDSNEIIARWSEHFSSLLNLINPVQPNFIENLQPSPVVRELDESPTLIEVINAVNHLKSGKSPGLDGIPPEVMKCGGYLLKCQLHQLIVQIWDEALVPQEMKDAVIITIYKKKGDRADCGNSRGISLLSIAGKVLAAIMLQRLNSHITEKVLPDSQYGFRKDRSTTDAVFSMRQIQEKCKEEKKNLYMAFIDLSKAFDTVNRELLWVVLQKFGVPEKYLSVLRQLHDGMQARVRAGGLTSDPFPVAVGVKQGCILAPALFNLFLAAINLITHNIIGGYKGVKIEYRLDGNLFNLRRLQAHTKTSIRHIIELQYADDLVLLANSPIDLQDSLDILTSAYVAMGLKVNINKTEVLIQHTGIEPIQPRFHIQGEVLKVVENFTYLGSTLDSSCSLDIEINARINNASAAFGRLNQRVFNNHHLKPTTKAAVYRAVCVSTLLYGAETWTLYCRHVRALEAFHMQCLRRILGISWQDHVSFDLIYERTNTTCIESTLAKRHLQWVGHVLRMAEDKLPRQLLCGQLYQGSRPPGGQKKRFKDHCKNLLKQCHLQPSALETLVADRVSWRSIVGECKKTIIDSKSTKRAENRTKRLERAAGIVYGGPQHTCDSCGKVCTSRIGLYSHTRWHQRRGR